MSWPTENWPTENWPNEHSPTENWPTEDWPTEDWPTENWPTENWLNIGALDDIPRQGARVVKTAAGCVAVFRTAQDRIFAMSDHCPHKGGPLSEGIVHGLSVTCPLHAWVFSLETGMARGADVGAVATYPVRVEAGRILLNVKRLARRVAA